MFAKLCSSTTTSHFLEHRYFKTSLSCPLNVFIIIKQCHSFVYPFSSLTISKYEKVISLKNSIKISQCWRNGFLQNWWKMRQDIYALTKRSLIFLGKYVELLNLTSNVTAKNSLICLSSFTLLLETTLAPPKNKYLLSRGNIT